MTAFASPADPAGESRSQLTARARFLAGLLSAADSRIPFAARELASWQHSFADPADEAEADEPRPDGVEPPGRPERPGGPEWRRFGSGPGR